MHSDYISKLGKQKNSLKYGCRHCRSSFKISHDITVMLHLLDPFSMMKTGPRSHAFLGESPALGCDVSNLHLTWTRGRKTLSTYPAGLRLEVKMSVWEVVNMNKAWVQGRQWWGCEHRSRAQPAGCFPQLLAKPDVEGFFWFVCWYRKI